MIPCGFCFCKKPCIFAGPPAFTTGAPPPETVIDLEPGEVGALSGEEDKEEEEEDEENDDEEEEVDPRGEEGVGRATEPLLEAFEESALCLGEPGVDALPVFESVLDLGAVTGDAGDELLPPVPFRRKLIVEARSFVSSSACWTLVCFSFLLLLLLLCVSLSEAAFLTLFYSPPHCCLLDSESWSTEGKRSTRRAGVVSQKQQHSNEESATQTKRRNSKERREKS